VTVTVASAVANADISKGAAVQLYSTHVFAAKVGLCAGSQSKLTHEYTYKRQQETPAVAIQCICCRGTNS
jgi:hypothetical protein